jgi:hypothetical protein
MSDVKLNDPAALDDLRVALVKFRHEVAMALAEVDSEVKRFIDFIESDRIPELKKSLPRLREAVVQAKTGLIRKQMNAAALKIPASVVDEKVAIRRAEAALAHQEELLKRTSSWLRKLETEYNLYRTHMSPLGTTIDRELPEAIQRLKNMSAAIEAYLSIAPTASLEEQLRAREAVQSVLRTGAIDLAAAWPIEEVDGLASTPQAPDASGSAGRASEAGGPNAERASS